MKILFYSSLLFLIGCTSVVSQPTDADAKKDEEFRRLIESSRNVSLHSLEVLKKANEKTSEIVVKASNKIVTLKKEVKHLKKQLYEVTNKPSGDDTTSVRFHLCPISDSTEDWERFSGYNHD